MRRFEVSYEPASGCYHIFIFGKDIIYDTLPASCFVGGSPKCVWLPVYWFTLGCLPDGGLRSLVVGGNQASPF